MSKKAILSTLLISSALLGTTAAANAATSAVQPESKLVSVEKDGVKIYKNSKLEESKEVAKGTVYKVDGYRDINNKKYYRVYQQDTKGKNVYKGYVLADDAQDLKASSVDKKDRFVGLTEDGQKAWKNLYFNREIKTYNGKKHSSNFEVKRTYEIGGKKYFSLYRGDQWMGYMDGSAFKVLTPKAIEEGKQGYKVVEDWNTYNDIYFTEKGKLTKGEKVTVKRVYTFGTGRQYGSLYNAEGKWIGYANMKALEEDKAIDNDIEKANDAIKKAEEILGKAQATKDSKDAAQKVIDEAKKVVASGNLDEIKKVPAKVAEAIKALKPAATTADITNLRNTIKDGEELINDYPSLPGIDKLKDALETGKKVMDEAKKGNATSEQVQKAIQDIANAMNDCSEKPSTPENPLEAAKDRANKAIKDAEDILQIAKNLDTKDTVKNLEDVITEAKKVVQGDNLDEIKAIPVKIEQALKDLKPTGVMADVISLRNAIKDAEQVVAHKAELTGTEPVEKALEAGKKVMEKALDKNATLDEIKKATDDINNAIKGIKLNQEGIDKLKAEVQEIADLAKKVYLTKDQEDKVNKFVADANEKLKDNSANNYDTLKETSAQAKEVKAFLDAQPDKETGSKLNKDIEDAKKLKDVKYIEHFDNIAAAKTAAEEANKILGELKQDQPDNNQATVKRTKREVADAAKKLEDALGNIQVNAEDMQKFIDANKAVMESLSSDDKSAAQAELDKLEAAVKKDPTLKNYEEIKKDATELAKKVSESYLKGWDHNVEGNEIILTDYTGNQPKLVIPGQIGGKDVKVKTPYSKWDLSMRAGIFANSPRTVDISFKEINGKKVGIKDNAAGMFLRSKATSVDLKGLDLSAATNLDALFQTSKVTSVDLTGQDLSNVTSAKAMFQSCSALTKVTLGDSFKNATGLTDISSMFSADSALATTPDIQNIYTASVTNVSNMFQQTALTDIDLSSLDFSNVTSSMSMFEGATKLTSIKFGDSFKNANKNESMNFMFKNNTALTTLDLTNVNTSAVTNMNSMFENCSALATLKLSPEFGAAATSHRDIDKNANQAVKDALKATKLAEKGYTGK